MVKCLPEFEYFTVFLKNRNFISKIRISKVTDYAALTDFAILCDNKWKYIFDFSLIVKAAPHECVIRTDQP